MSDSNKALKEKLLSSRKNGFDRVDAAELEQMEAYCKEYMAFLDAGKTERLCAAETVRLAEQAMPKRRFGKPEREKRTFMRLSFRLHGPFFAREIQRRIICRKKRSFFYYRSEKPILPTIGNLTAGG